MTNSKDDKFDSDVSLWHSRNFTGLWLGETVSSFGSAITTLSIPLLAIIKLNATPFELGILQAAAFLPFLILSLPFGVWVDQFRHRPVLIAANIGRFLLLGTIPVLTYYQLLDISYLCAISFLVGTLTVIFELAYQSFLPVVVQENQLIEANSKLNASAALAEVGGPGLAGILVQMITAPLAILLDAFSFLFSALSLWSIDITEPVKKKNGGNFFCELSESLKLATGSRYLIFSTAAGAQCNLFWNLIQVALLVLLTRELQISPFQIGIIFMMRGAGSFIGAVSSLYWIRKIGLGTTIVASSILYGIPLLILPFRLFTNIELSMITISFGLFLSGLGMVTAGVAGNGLLQASIPDEMRGRLSAFTRFLRFGAIPLGSVLGGTLGGLIGLDNTLLFGSIGISLCWLWHFFSPAARLTEIPKSPAQARALIEHPLFR